MPAALKIILLSLVIVAAAYDLRFRRIPNWLCLSGLILGIGVNTLFFGRDGFVGAASGLLCAFVIYFLLYLLRGMAAGDVKLMGAIGSIMGAHGWLVIFLTTAIIGGLVSLIAIVVKKRTRQTFSNVAVIGAELLHFRVPSVNAAHLDVRNPEALRLPHGAVIAASSVVFLVFGAPNYL
jgi:prepilin peptidase CpaA